MLKLFRSAVAFLTGGQHVRHVGRLLLLAGCVGVMAGIGAVAFFALSQVVVHYTLALVAGYHPGGPAGEGQIFGPEGGVLDRFSPWLLLAVITGGGLVSGALVYWLAPDAEGHGTDNAIKAYHRGRGLIPPRVPLVKLVASAVTIGTGGSGGREGPIAQIGAGFGSFLAVKLNLSESDRRVLLAAGLGAGVAAIFRAPLAGAIFAAEVLYSGSELEAEALIPAFISCTVSYCVFGLASGFLTDTGSLFSPIFKVAPGLTFNDPVLLAPLTVLAVFMVLASLGYVRCFYGLRALFARIKLPKHFRPALGALAAGLVAVAAFHLLAPAGREAQGDSLSVLSFGYGILQKAFDGGLPQNLTAAVALLLVVGLGKLVTTSLTIGSGGSGGVFGPSMVIGGALGGVVGLLFQRWMPGTVTRIDVFIIMGMAGFFTAAAKTPFSTLVIVSELTGGYELLLPAMWVSALAYLLSRGWTIYREQVPSRADSPAHYGDFVIGVLDGLAVRDVWTPRNAQVVTIPSGMPFRRIVDEVTSTSQSVFPVVDESGEYRGMFGLNDVRKFLADSETLGDVALACDLAGNEVKPLRTDSDLLEAMKLFAKIDYEELPVVDDGSPARVIGILRRQDLMSAYNERLIQARSHVPSASGETE